ncbi:MAG: Peptidase M14, carboxypeptidase A, partial [Parcubacteria group bacterium GW2011_GWC1_41_7]
ILPQTLDIMNVYAHAAGYPAVKSFDAYEVHGDSEGWLASIGIPALTVELSTHDTIEWDKNLAGIEALFTYFSR